jgi:hypothetical protein
VAPEVEDPVYMFLVYYGARPEGGEDDEMLVEVHAFLR